MTIYGVIYPKLEYTETYCDTDTLLYALRDMDYTKVIADRETGMLKTAGRIWNSRQLKRSDTDQYNRMSDYAKAMTSFIQSLNTKDIVLLPDITYLGNHTEEILSVYHHAWNQGVHLEFNRGRYGNTENYMYIETGSQKELFRIIDHLLIPLIEEMKAERMEEVSAKNINDVSPAFKKNYV